MTKEEIEFVKVELEKCIKEQLITLEIKRTKYEEPYTVEIHLDLDGNPSDFLKKITRKSRLTKNGSCNLILQNEKFDFRNQEIQGLWCNLCDREEEDIFINDLLNSSWLF